MVDHEDRQRWRVAMLDTLYDAVDADPRGIASGPAVAHAAGVPPEQAPKVATYLEDAGLLKGIWSLGSQMPELQITKYGIDQIERARSAPERETDHLAPMNIIINHGTMTGVQQGNENVQNLTVTGSSLEQIKAAVAELREALPRFDSEERHVAEAQIVTIEAQVESGAPIRPVLQGAIEALKAIGYGAVASGAVEAISRAVG